MDRVDYLDVLAGTEVKSITYEGVVGIDEFGNIWQDGKIIIKESLVGEDTLRTLFNEYAEQEIGEGPAAFLEEAINELDGL